MSVSGSPASRVTGTDSPVSADVSIWRARDQPRVGGDAVALRQHHDIAGNELAGLDETAATVTQNGDVLGQERSERLDGALGLPLLEQREGRVQQDDADDRPGQDRRSGEPGERGSRPEQESERMRELLRDVTPPAAPAATHDLIRAVADQPALDLAARQPLGARAQIREQPSLGLRADHVYVNRLGPRK